MSNEHTPGPWVWSGNSIAGGLHSVMEMWCQGGSVVLNTTPADRALIAAAPDLLAALRYIEAEGYLDRVDTREIVRAAIARATGEEDTDE